MRRLWGLLSALTRSPGVSAWQRRAVQRLSDDKAFQDLVVRTNRSVAQQRRRAEEQLSDLQEAGLPEQARAFARELGKEIRRSLGR